VLLSHAEILKRDNENCDDSRDHAGRYNFLGAKWRRRGILKEEVAAWNKGDADAYSHDRNDMACHMHNAGVLSPGIPLPKDLRGLSPTWVQDTIHSQGLHHPLISLRSSLRRIHRTTTLLLSSVYRATLPPKHNAKARPSGAKSARLLACGKGS